MKKTLLIHHNDLDGFGSAWLYRVATSELAGGELPVRDITVSYPTQIESIPVAGYDVVIIDLECPEDQYRRILAEANSLMVFDHHPVSVKMAELFPDNNILANEKFKRFIENDICTVSAAKLVHHWFWFEVWDSEEDRFSDSEMTRLAASESAIEEIAEAISLQDLGYVPTFDYTKVDSFEDIINIANEQGVDNYQLCGYLLNLICGAFHKKQSLYNKFVHALYDSLLNGSSRVLSVILKMNDYMEIAEEALKHICSAYKRLLRSREVRIKLKDGSYCRVKCCGEIMSLLLVSTSYFAKAEDPADIIAVKRDTEDGITFSIRSYEKSKVSARQFATLYGGGGHEFTSGISYGADADKLAEQLLYPPELATVVIDDFLKL